MDKQEYLNQISAANRPAKSGGKLSKLFSSKIFLLIVGAVAVFILLAIIGAVLSGSRGGMESDSYALKMRIDNTMSVVNNYRKLIKSSVLRSDSVSLQSVLSNTNRDLDSYLADKYKRKSSEINKAIGEKKVEQLTLEKDGLEAELFEAKINGNLDRIYAHKLSYEISVIMSEEGKIYNGDSDDTLKSILSTSYTSLENLYNSISNFSEAK
ncbi:MAG: hypothetical protein Q4A70_01510 [Candidatus Saccharibacteria bacterium]|nr:hypothetical protein [Candidatus Saccharibacteria bacterium]